MRRVARNRCWQCLPFGVYVSCLLAVFYFYVLLRIQPHLLYHLNPAIFLTDSDFFFTEFLDRPGGASSTFPPSSRHCWCTIGSAR